MGRLTMDAEGKVVEQTDLGAVAPDGSPAETLDAGTHSSEPAPETSDVAAPTVRLLSGVVEHADRTSGVRRVDGDQYEVLLPGLPIERLDTEGALRLAGALERAGIDGAPAIAIEWNYGTTSHEDTMTAADAQALAQNLRGALAEAAA